MVIERRSRKHAGLPLRTGVERGTVRLGMIARLCIFSVYFTGHNYYDDDDKDDDDDS